MLEFQDIHKQFGKHEVLSGISLILERGKSIVLRGPSGSGKSTLLRIGALLETPDQGSVQIKDKSVSHQNPWPGIGVLFQQLHLWPHLTLRENIELPLRCLKLSTKSALAYAKLLDVAHVLDHYPREASLGQRQRIALLRAICVRPSYLLLDEPTSALDDDTTTLVMELLSELVRDGVGILVATHHAEHILTRHLRPDLTVKLVEGKLVESESTYEKEIKISVN